MYVLYLTCISAAAATTCCSLSDAVMLNCVQEVKCKVNELEKAWEEKYSQHFLTGYFDTVLTKPCNSFGGIPIENTYIWL